MRIVLFNYIVSCPYRLDGGEKEDNMNRLEEVILKGIELNNAIERLNEEIKTLDSITMEKRKAKHDEILNDLIKYKDIMNSLKINTIDFRVKYGMFYYGLTRSMGIKLRIWEYDKHPVMQIDLGVYSDVTEGFYARHSMGVVASGMQNEEILSEFCEQWENIKNVIDEVFLYEVEKILQIRKEKAVNDREKAIKNLTSIK